MKTMKRKSFGVFICFMFIVSIYFTVVGSDEEININYNENSIKIYQKSGNKPLPNNEKSDENKNTDWWSKFHHDLSNTGETTSIAPESNDVLWNYKTGRNGVDSSPAVVDERVYIGNLDGNVYCIDANNGSEIWNYTTGGWIESSPAVADGKVYIGNRNGDFYCFNAYNGSVIWSYSNGAPWGPSSPAVADGKIYVGHSYGEHVVYCLDANDGSIEWISGTGSEVFSSPAVVDGRVYVGSLDYNVYCLYANNGSKIWNYTTDSFVDSAPAVSNGKVYIGSADDNIYCLNASNGNKIWNYVTGGDVDSSPALSNGKVYVGSLDGNIYCLYANNGTKLWNYTTGDKIRSSPAVADGKLFIGSYDNRVYCLNASNGNLYWSYITGNILDSSPAVADGKVYIGSRDSNVYCFGEISNNRPNTPVLNYPLNGSIVIENNPVLNVTISDPDNDNMTVTFFERNTYYQDEETSAYGSPQCYDEDWDTFRQVNVGAKEWVYENFTIPNDINNAEWTFKWECDRRYGNSDVEVSFWDYSCDCWNKVFSTSGMDDGPYIFTIDIPEDCLDTMLRVETYFSGHNYRAKYFEGKVKWIENDTIIGTSHVEIQNNSSVNQPWNNLFYNSSYYWYVEVSDGFRKIKSPNWYFTTAFKYQIQIGADWNLVSVPVNQSIEKNNLTVNYLDVNYTWQQAVDNSYLLDFLYGWNVISQSYTTTNYFTPGESYWMYAYDNLTLWITTEEQNTDDYIASLSLDWNLISIPFNTNIAKENIIINYSGMDYSWQQAVDASIILGFIYGWDEDTQSYQTNNILIPGRGYWLYSYYDCILKKS